MSASESKKLPGSQKAYPQKQDDSGIHPATEIIEWFLDDDTHEEYCCYNGHHLRVRHLSPRAHIGYVDGNPACQAVGPMWVIADQLFTFVDELS